MKRLSARQRKIRAENSKLRVKTFFSTFQKNVLICSVIVLQIFAVMTSISLYAEDIIPEGIPEGIPQEIVAPTSNEGETTTTPPAEEGESVVTPPTGEETVTPPSSNEGESTDIIPTENENETGTGSGTGTEIGTGTSTGLVVPVEDKEDTFAPVFPMLLGALFQPVITPTVDLSVIQAWDYDYQGAMQTFTVAQAGYYKLETWGAEGGGYRASGNSASGLGGKGGYTQGYIYLNTGDILRVNVGGLGASSTLGIAAGGRNGGGSGYASSASEPGNGGGGATDIRLGTNLIGNRIIVAGGGGGGGEDYGDIYGHGGGLAGEGYPGYDATQTTAGPGGDVGLPGRGASTDKGDGGGGGGGYHGGGSLSSTSIGADTQGGGGGSSYIGTLISGSTITGNATMPNPSGGSMQGKINNGYARVSLVDSCLALEIGCTTGSIVKNKYNYTGSMSTFTASQKGVYKLQVWGAEGGGSRISGNGSSGLGGKGGYSQGLVHLNTGDVLYVFIGGQGGSSTNGLALGGRNGGGNGYASSAGEPGNGGGGASDIRMGGTDLTNRIIVAGGGGGGGEDSGDPYGHGGGLAGVGYPGYDATQTAPGYGGSLGQGGSTDKGDGGGGGGGYYGGGTYSSPYVGNDTQGGGGGSAYLGGVSNGITIAGDSEMPAYAGGGSFGNLGNGHAIISLTTIPDSCPAGSEIYNDTCVAAITITQVKYLSGLVAGTAEPNSIVQIANGSGSFLLTGDVDANGGWTLDLSAQNVGFGPLYVSYLDNDFQLHQVDNLFLGGAYYSSRSWNVEYPNQTKCFYYNTIFGMPLPVVALWGDDTGWRGASNSAQACKTYANPGVYTTYVLNTDALQYLQINGQSLTGDINLSESVYLNSLDLGNNQLSQIPDVHGLNQLSDFNFYGNNLTTLNATMLQGLEHVSNLNFDNNKISHIDTGTFDQFTNLQNLNMNQNDIDHLDREMFRSLSGLYSINFQNNRISTIENGTFSQLPNLQYIYLDNNQLSSIEPGVFNNLNNVYGLQLGYNQISHIDAGSFLGMTNLQNINIENNDIATLIPGTFDGNQNLSSIYLYGNDITEIPTGVFSDLPTLYNIHLGDNLISHIDADSFTNLPNLNSLDLYSNEITSIATGAFDSFPNLYSLNLQNNRLETLPSGIVNGMRSDGYAYFDNNCLDINDPASVPTDVRTWLQNRGLASFNSNICGNLDVDQSIAINASGIQVGISGTILTGDYGNTALFTITYANKGKKRVNDVQVQQKLASEIEIQSSTPSYTSSYSDTNGTFKHYIWNIGALNSGQTGEITITGFISPTPSSSTTNGSFKYVSNGSSCQELPGASCNNPSVVHDENANTFWGLKGDETNYMYYYFSDNTYVDTVQVLFKPGDIGATPGKYSFKYYDNTQGWIDPIQWKSSSATQGVDTVYTFTLPKPVLSSQFMFERNEAGENQGIGLAELSFSLRSDMLPAGKKFISQVQIYSTNNYKELESSDNVATASIMLNVPIEPTLTYTTTGITNQDVGARVSFNKTGVVILNNSGNDSYLFTGNGTFTFQYTDGYTGGSIDAIVNWIDKTAPIGTISYSTTGATKGNVTATLTTTDNANVVIITNNSGYDTHTFDKNGDFIFTFMDAAGNSGSVTATVNWIVPESLQGGSRGRTQIEDPCPAGDFSPSLYDDTCVGGALSSQTEENSTQEQINTHGTASEGDEMTRAWEWAHTKGIMKEKRFDTRIMRVELAKMLSEYAITALGKTSTPNEACYYFNDPDGLTDEMRTAVVNACELGIMGLASNGTDVLPSFNPYGQVTRAEFATAFSRMLYGHVYDSNDENHFWKKHIDHLKDEKILSETSPLMKELRGWVLLMLFRSVK